MKEIEKIDLEKILLKHAKDVIHCNKLDIEEIEDILFAMKEACNQAIDLCTENADADYTYLGDSLKADDLEVYVLKNSILNVKNLIQ